MCIYTRVKLGCPPKVSGHLVYTHSTTTWQPRPKAMGYTVIGYPFTQKGYECYFPDFNHYGCVISWRCPLLRDSSSKDPWEGFSSGSFTTSIILSKCYNLRKWKWRSHSNNWRSSYKWRRWSIWRSYSREKQIDRSIKETSTSVLSQEEEN